MDTLINDWKNMINIGEHVKYGSIDGLTVWRSQREHFSNISTIFDIRNSKIYTLHHLVKYIGSGAEHENASINIKGIEMKYGGTNIEHFFVQLFRIPVMFNFRIPYIKLMQIAYNISQLKSHLDDYDSNIVEFFVKYKLDHLSTFV